jgi:folate-dependent phosphoribosylglycinamide formyltransferase PurN
MLNIGWFSTARGEGSQNLLKTVQQSIVDGEIKGNIDFVFCNRERGESEQTDIFLDLVNSFDITLVCYSSKKFREHLSTINSNDSADGIQLKEKASDQIDPSKERWRILFDREVEKRIRQFTPDIIVLAGYMLILGEELCQHYTMINLHPAAPGGPTGTWKEVMWKLIEERAEQAGAMMHLVIPELDKGPAISYCLFPIQGFPFAPYWQNDDKDGLFQLIRQHELKREFPLIVYTLRALSQGDISIKKGRVFDSHGKAIQGYDLSTEIDRIVN